MEGGINMSKTAMKEALMHIYAGNSDMAIEVLEMALKDSEAKQELKVDAVIDAVTRVTGMHLWDMQAKVRKKEFVKARHYAMYAVCKYTNLSLKQIGSMFGNRDHSTVIHARDTIDDLIKFDKSYCAEWAMIEAILKGGNASC
jgi:chromosomal replication initiator protein